MCSYQIGFLIQANLPSARCKVDMNVRRAIPFDAWHGVVILKSLGKIFCLADINWNPDVVSIKLTEDIVTSGSLKRLINIKNLIPISLSRGSDPIDIMITAHRLLSALGQIGRDCRALALQLGQAIKFWLV